MAAKTAARAAILAVFRGLPGPVLARAKPGPGPGPCQDPKVQVLLTGRRKKGPVASRCWQPGRGRVSYKLPPNKRQRIPTGHHCTTFGVSHQHMAAKGGHVPFLPILLKPRVFLTRVLTVLTGLTAFGPQKMYPIEVRRTCLWHVLRHRTESVVPPPCGGGTERARKSAGHWHPRYSLTTPADRGCGALSTRTARLKPGLSRARPG